MFRTVRLLLCSTLVVAFCGCSLDYGARAGGDSGAYGDDDDANVGRLLDAGVQADAGADDDADLGDAPVDASADASEPFVATRTYPGACVEHYEVPQDATNPGSAWENRYTYDAQDRITDLIVVSITPEHAPVRYIYHHNEEGLLIEREEDQEDDGVTDAEWRYMYDAEDRMIRAEHYGYVVIAGIPIVEILTTIRSYVYNDAGDLLSVTWTDPAGTVTFISIYTYGMDGAVECDTESPLGNPLSRYRWFYDENGRLVTEEVINPHTDEIRIVRRYDYNAGGDVASVLYSAPGDPQYDYRTTNTYDAFRNLLEAEELYLSDGSLRIRTTYSYDCFDRRPK